MAQLAAPIRGIADFSRLVSEDYRQYRRTIRTAWAAAVVLACVSAAALWQWRDAVAQRAEAQANAEQAKANAAEATANAEKADANARQADAEASKRERMLTLRRPKPTYARRRSGSRGSWPIRRASSAQR